MAASMSRQEPKIPCARFNGLTRTNCSSPATMACSCGVVAYCSKNCKKRHQQEHKTDCKSSLCDKHWKPAWDRDDRMPAFVDGNGTHSMHGTVKYLWGNVPAIDVVRLAENEGTAFPGPLNLLFAASGDLRNVIQSIASLPKAYTGTVNVVINDMDFDVVARNAILLLLFLTVDDAEVAAEHAIHLWYSAFLTQPCFDVLQTKVKPLVQAMCDQVPYALDHAGKTWQFDDPRLRLNYYSWYRLLSFLSVPEDLTTDAAQKIRHAVVLAPERVDYRDRHLLVQTTPAHRLCISKYWSDGIVLPFGASRADYTIPNPTLFHNDHTWPMMDSANPLNGWHPDAVLQTDAGPATHDLYGKLHCHLTTVFRQFHKQLRTRRVSFQLFQKDARDLVDFVQISFARIEAANIADGAYLGIRDTLHCLAPLLQTPEENRHETLLLLFLNAVKEAHMWGGSSKQTLQDVDNALRWMDVSRGASITTAIVKATAAANAAMDVNMLFNRYMSAENFKKATASARLAIKNKNTIVDKSPLRVALSGSSSAAERLAFSRLLASGHTGQETYVEWTRETPTLKRQRSTFWELCLPVTYLVLLVLGIWLFLRIGYLLLRCLFHPVRTLRFVFRNLLSLLRLLFTV